MADLPRVVVTALSGSRYTGLAETDYQNQVKEALSSRTAGHDLVVVAEAQLTPTERIDFLINGTVGVEVKTQGSRAAVIRQLGRYAATGKVTTLVLASSKRMLVKNLPDQIHGVPVIPVVLKGSVL